MEGQTPAKENLHRLKNKLPILSNDEKTAQMRSAATSIPKAELPRRSYPAKSPSGSNISKMGNMSGILVTLCKDQNKRVQRWFSKYIRFATFSPYDIFVWILRNNF